MIIKTFTGATVRDALQKVRSAFGPDAVILDTAFDRKESNRLADPAAAVTVTAAYAPDEELPQEIEGSRTLRLSGALAGETEDGAAPDMDEGAATDGLPADAEVSTVTEPPAPGETGMSAGEADDRAYRALTEAIRRLHAGIAGAHCGVEADTLWSHVRAWLATQPELVRGLADAFATHLVESIPPPEAFNDKNTNGQTVLFIGGRGTGKSSALTKCLAARWRSTNRKPRALVLSDGNSHGQERTVAWCKDCEITLDTHAIGRAVRRGRLKRDKGEDLFVELVTDSHGAEDASRVRSILRTLKPNVIVQVIPATGSPRAWHADMNHLAAFGATHLVVTHWDALTPWWELLAVVRDTRLIPAYRTTGPEPFAQCEPFTESDLRTGVMGILAQDIGGDPARRAEKVVTS